MTGRAIIGTKSTEKLFLYQSNLPNFPQICYLFIVPFFLLWNVYMKRESVTRATLKKLFFIVN